jgi:hypothetical protein
MMAIAFFGIVILSTIALRLEAMFMEENNSKK